LQRYVYTEAGEAPEVKQRQLLPPSLLRDVAKLQGKGRKKEASDSTVHIDKV
jgi:hypothetical protein